MTTSRVVLISLCLAGVASSQEQKHMMSAPLSGARPSTLTAFEIERGTPYPSSIHLKGRVEIKTPVCLPVGTGGKPVCDGEMILRADEAIYHEDSGEIEAMGAVTVTPLRHQIDKVSSR